MNNSSSGTYSSATSSGTYLEKLPKDIIGYLRGFTGPDPLYQIPYQLRKEDADGNMCYYSLFATSKKVKDQIVDTIRDLPLSKYNMFHALYSVPDSLHRIGVDTRHSWDDPIKTIKIEGRTHLVIPMKLHVPKHIFQTVTEFKKEILDFNFKMKTCSTIGCKEKRPKELDYCWKCLEKCRDTDYSDPRVLHKRRREHVAVKKSHQSFARSTGGIVPRRPAPEHNGQLKRRRMFLPRDP